LRLPLQLQLKSLRVDELRIDDQPAMHDLQLTLELGTRQGTQHRVALQQLRWEHVGAMGQARIGTDPPFAIEGSLRAKAASGTPWQAEATARGALSSVDLKLRLNGQALDNGPPPTLDAQAQLRPFESWPLGDVTATTQALDLASVLPRAPRTRLDGRAAIRSQGLRQPVDIDIQLDNGVPARFSEGGIPLHALRLAVKADPRQPQRLVLGPFDIEAAPASGMARP
jgi:translocation and assembly module TamB